MSPEELPEPCQQGELVAFVSSADGFDFLKIGESMLEGQSPPFIGEGGVATDERSSDPAACMEAPVM